MTIDISEQKGPDWKLQTGYRGLKSWVWRNEWEVVVREDFLVLNRPRFRVLEHQVEVGRFDTLKAAQMEALRRLIELGEEN